MSLRYQGLAEAQFCSLLHSLEGVQDSGQLASCLRKTVGFPCEYISDHSAVWSPRFKALNCLHEARRQGGTTVSCVVRPPKMNSPATPGDTMLIEQAKHFVSHEL